MPGLAEEEGAAQEWVVAVVDDSRPALEAIASPVVEVQGIPVFF